MAAQPTRSARVPTVLGAGPTAVAVGERGRRTATYRWRGVNAPTLPTIVMLRLRGHGSRAHQRWCNTKPLGLSQLHIKMLESPFLLGCAGGTTASVGAAAQSASAPRVRNARLRETRRHLLLCAHEPVRVARPLQRPGAHGTRRATNPSRRNAPSTAATSCASPLLPRVPLVSLVSLVSLILERPPT